MDNRRRHCRKGAHPCCGKPRRRSDEVAYRAKRSRAFVGSPEGAVELIRRCADLGVTQFMTVFPFGEELRSMRLFADRVIPRAG